MVDREPVATSADPIAMVLGLGLLLERLGLPGELAASRRLLKRSEVLGEAGRAAQMAAGQRRAEATRELLAGDGEVDTEALAVVVRETDVWLAFTPGDPKPAPAMGVLMDAARMARGHAGAMLTASAPGIYPKLQRVAAETVAATAALPKLPAAIWSAPDPALVAVREGHAETLKQMWVLSDRYDDCHRAGRICRQTGGLGAQTLLDAAPDAIGFALANWQKAAAEMDELRQVRPPLRLRFMIDRGWEPGLWLAADLQRAEAARQKRKPGVLAGLLGR